MFLNITEKIIREIAFDPKKKKPRLNLNLGYALIGLRTTGPNQRVKYGTAISRPRMWERLDNDDNP